MNWVYWLSGAAALVIFVYLIVALFKPERLRMNAYRLAATRPLRRRSAAAREAARQLHGCGLRGPRASRAAHRRAARAAALSRVPASIPRAR